MSATLVFAGAKTTWKLCRRRSWQRPAFDSRASATADAGVRCVAWLSVPRGRVRMLRIFLADLHRENATLQRPLGLRETGQTGHGRTCDRLFVGPAGLKVSTVPAPGEAAGHAQRASRRDGGGSLFAVLQCSAYVPKQRPQSQKKEPVRCAERCQERGLGPPAWLQAGQAEPCLPSNPVQEKPP